MYKNFIHIRRGISKFITKFKLIITKMERIQELLLEFYTKNQSVIKVQYNPEAIIKDYKAIPGIIISGLDWNDYSLIFPWNTNIIPILEKLIEDRYHKFIPPPLSIT
jgi:hypothetical protein